METKDVTTAATNPPDSGTQQEADEIVRKYDSESRFRVLKGKIGLVVGWIAIVMSTFHILTAVPFTIVTAKQMAVHLAFALVLIFLMYPATKNSNKVRPTVFDYLWAAAGAVSVGYLLFMYETIANRGMVSTTLDLVMGGICIVVVLEGARRSVGKELPILSIIFLGYAYLGPYLPGFLAHRGYSVKTLIEQMYLGSEGIFGMALSVSASYIFLFILFGAFLNGTGMSQFFTVGSMALAGHKAGGPAKVSILASGSLGMINGSAVANVVTTGVFTVPLMKNVGYKKHFAGAVEAVASTGGQIMPPIMGAAAFIMAEFLGIPYLDVIIAALIPAILYYVALWFMVHYQAVKDGLKGVPKDQLPDFKKVLKERFHLLLPIFLLMYLLFQGYTPVFAAFYSIIATYLISFVRKETRMSFKMLLETLENGAKGAISIAMATAVVGFIIGIVSLTGVGLQLANLILVLSNEQLILTMIFSMVACIILGMGLPTAACYIVAVTVVAPALIDLGVAPITAHLFVLYFACLSAITPPVALAAYAGAGVANAPPSKVGWTAFRLGITGFIVPFVFVYSPSLLLQNSNFMEVALALITAFIGVMILAASIIGYWKAPLNYWERIVLFAAAICLIVSGLLTDIIGIGLIAIILMLQLRKVKSISSAM